MWLVAITRSSKRDNDSRMLVHELVRHSARLIAHIEFPYHVAMHAIRSWLLRVSVSGIHMTLSTQSHVLILHVSSAKLATKASYAPSRLTLMSTVASLLDELGCVEEFLQQQSEAGLEVDSVREAQCNSFMVKCQGLPTLSLADASRLTQAVRTGSWSPVQVRSMAGAISARSLATSTPGVQRGRRATQQCDTFQLYLTRGDWDQLKNTRSHLNSKIFVICTRALSIGLRNPDESTAARMATILQLKVLGETSMSGASQYNLLQEVKTTLWRMRETDAFPYEHLAVFPSSPRDLRPEVFEYAYKEDEPAEENVDHLSGVVSNSCKRKSHRSMRSDMASSSAPMVGMSMVAPQAHALTMLNKAITMLFGNHAQFEQPLQLGFGGTSAPALTMCEQPSHLGLGGTTANALAMLAPRASASLPSQPSSDSLATQSTPQRSPPSRNCEPDSPAPHMARVPRDPEANDKLSMDVEEQVLRDAMAERKAEKGADKRAGSKTKAKGKAKANGKAKAKPTPKSNCEAPTLKRPSAAIATPRGAPPAPLGSPKSPPPAVLWNGGKIYTSWSKRAYRVKRTASDRVDVAVNWSAFESQDQAWARALQLIQEQRDAEA